MRSIVVTKPYHYEIREEEIPVCRQDTDVLIQMKVAGVCGSDIHIFRGENAMARYPLVLGHENAGVVRAVGKGVSGYRPGDRVVVEQTQYCGRCYPCRIGHSNVCEQLRVRGSSLDGGFREYFICDEKSLFPLPDSLSFLEGAMVEPFTIAAQCVRKAKVTPEDTVLIQGAGTIGSILVQACRNVGAAILCSDIDADNLSRAKRYGAAMTVHTKEQDLTEAVRDFTGGHGVTLAIDAVGLPGSLVLLLSPGILSNAGRLLNLGFSKEPEAGLAQCMLTGREIDLLSSRLQDGQYPPTIEAFCQGRYDLEGLVSDVIPFAQIDRVFENMIHPEPKIKKMMISFEE